VVSIPGFQRNYVWDQKRASKLIESLLIGLPIPQIFLYEEGRNKFSVIDGQQRLMSIYFFKKKRFPRMECRAELRKIATENGTIPANILSDDKFFVNFNLKLPSRLPSKINRFDGKNYDTLEDYQSTFDLRTVRNIVIRQNTPDDDDSSIYEIFSRLNSGGINLTSQEIRVSLYHSGFYTMLYRINQNLSWRELIGQKEVDLHSKDIEILLRAFAMLWYSADYKPSMTRFLNESSRKLKQLKEEDINYCEELFLSFLNACKKLDDKSFISSRGRFNLSTFEAVFVALAEEPFSKRELVTREINIANLKKLKENEAFKDATQIATASSANVAQRKKSATELLLGDL
jgi:uncharacterized protein with ParB-like and HNH nuclease domain